MKQRTFDEVLIPKDSIDAFIDRLGNMEFLDDQMFGEDDKLHKSWSHLTYITTSKGFVPYII